MRNLRAMLMAAALIVAAAAGATSKYVGGDISLLSEYEDHGATYYQTDGSTKITDLLGYFADQGHNAMRVRLFHTPDNASDDDKGEGVCQDLEYVATLGKKIKDAGFALLLDFHYSDTWADPVAQWIPLAWSGLSDDVLADSVYEYTKYALTFLKAQGVTPDFIQTGNEISYGMLWSLESSGSTSNKFYAGTTSSSSSVYTRFISFLKKAGAACREVCPDAKIVIHTERVANTTYMKNFYQIMEDNSIDYDIIGLSFYPVYHGTISRLSSALDVIDNNFSDKEVMIVEAGYHHAYYPSDATYDLTSTYPATDDGQLAFTEDLITVLLKHSCVTGLFWWWMEANECGLNWSTMRVTDSWYNASLFDNSNGKAMQAITVLQDFLKESTGGDDDEDGVYFYYINDLSWDNVYVAIYDSSWSFLFDTTWAEDASYNVEMTNIVGTYDGYNVYKYTYSGSSTATPVYIIFFNGGYGTGNQSANCTYSQGAYYNSSGSTSLTDNDITPNSGVAAALSDKTGITIIAANGQISVEGADDAAIYTLGGQPATASGQLPAGVYIVNAGGEAHKVILR